MIIAIFTGLVLFLSASSVHYFALTRIYAVLTDMAKPRLLPMLLGISGAGLAHLLEALLYAAGFSLMNISGAGGFKGSDADSFMDIYYFSLVNYTSLGLGDIYPTGHSRFLAGLESLNGFLLISCSASFVFILMHHELGAVRKK